jgi:hypothetical protein
MLVRRLVTGQSAAGMSAIVSDEHVQPITVGLIPGAEFHALWGSDTPHHLPANTTSGGKTQTWFPPAGGFRFGLVTLPPDAEASKLDMPIDAAFAEFRQKLPGMLETMEPENPGMHMSDTIDFVYIVSGEIWLDLGDGAPTRVSAGECVIQNGTRHAWRNSSTAPCVMAVALIGTPRI